ncbi:MAG: DUF4388 domain-containing protein [Chloroflexia bacterium]|nr:DUF4388 domain-containing protein [Chloroflexia bacterium]
MPLEGDLSEFSLPDIIQLVDLSKQTGAVHIAGSMAGKAIEGWIYFRNGELISARFGRLPAEEALHALFTLPAGHFVFEEGVDLPPREIKASNEKLIIEGIRRVDEWEQLKEKAPALDVVLGLVSIPDERRKEISLEPEEWRVLTLIDGRNTIGEIAERSGLGEFRTTQIVLHLLETGLVEEKEVFVGQQLFEELGRIAVETLGHSATVLLEDAFRRQGVEPGEEATPQQVQLLCQGFERSISLLVGPSRARRLVDDMRTRAQQIFGVGVWESAVGK